MLFTISTPATHRDSVLIFLRKIRTESTGLRPVDLVHQDAHEVHVEVSTEASIALAGLILKASAIWILGVFEIFGIFQFIKCVKIKYILYEFLIILNIFYFSGDLKKYIAISSIFHCSSFLLRIKIFKSIGIPVCRNPYPFCQKA